MKLSLNLLLVACLSLFALGCPGPASNNPDTGKPAGKDGSTTCATAKQCGTACCGATESCDTTVTPNVCKTCSCGTRNCGNDECGNSCGACTVTGETCDGTGHCKAAATCSPACSGETPVCDTTGATPACKCNAFSCGTGKSCVAGACVANSCSPSCSGETPICSGTTCTCDGTSCAYGKSCVAGACVTNTCTPACTGKTPDCVGTACQCNIYSCAAGESCVGGACVANTCAACTGETPDCHGTVCQCNGSSCAAGKACLGGICITNTCTPTCTGETPDCVGTACKCNKDSCGTSKSCIGGVCVTNTCTGCTGETPDCVGTTCKCNSTSCGTGKSCLNGACITNTCTPTCTGTAPDCVGTQCKCNTTSCGSGYTCLLGTCIPNSCNPACTGTTPTCVGTVCQCNSSSCGTSATCVAGVCVPNTCTPACTGETPSCVGTTCKCTGTAGTQGSCNAGKTCGADGACHSPAVCTPACTGQTPTCDPATLNCLCTSSSCTGTGMVCATNGTCIDSSTDCDPLAANPCPTAGDGCFYDGTAYSCTAAGTVATGGTCTSTALCAAHNDCFGSGASGTCRKYCNPAASTTGCGSGESCVDLGDGIGYCNATCPAAHQCGSACCMSTQKCDTTSNTCQPLTPCDPLHPTACVTGEGCYWVGSNRCAKAGTVGTGATCTYDAECIPGDTCPSSTGKCALYCDPLGGDPKCTGSDTCTDYNDGTGHCSTCPTAQVCGSSCCTTSQTCDTTVTPNVCKTKVTCDPVAPTACTAGTQGCYVSWDNGDFECMTVANGTGACTLYAPTPFCAATTDCFPDATGIAGKCEKFCTVGGTGICLTSETCKALTTTKGYCSPTPIVACNIYNQASCTGTGKGCYPATNGATNCLTAGTATTTCNSAKIEDCIAGWICLDDGSGTNAGTCSKICNPTGTPTGCTGTDQCAALSGQTFGYCEACPTAQVCASACCKATQACNTSVTPNVCKDIIACDPLAPTACNAATEGCYYDSARYSYSCAPKGSVATGGTCSATLVCVPGDDCDSTHVCQPYCNSTTGTGCPAAQECTYYHYSKGICQACSAALCGSACCKSTENCTANVCVTKVACLPYTPNACPTGQGCYIDASGYTCQAPAGTAATGATCTASKNCVPGDGCNDCVSASSCKCTPYCNTAVANTCTGTGYFCQSVNQYTGSCMTCPTAQQCGTSNNICCQSSETCDAGTHACVSKNKCDPLKATPAAQGCTTAGQACYYDWGASDAFICMDISAGLPNGLPTGDTTCSADSDCVAGDGCNGGSFDTCSPYCPVKSTTFVCPDAADTCQDLDGTNGYCGQY